MKFLEFIFETLIDELGLKEDIIELPDRIDYILRMDGKYKTDNKLNINDLFQEAISKSSSLNKDKLINMTFFQYLILIFDFFHSFPSFE